MDDDMMTRTVMLALGLFAAVNAMASLVSWLIASLALWPRLREEPWRLVLIRAFPAGASLILVGVVFLPSHWALEPRDMKETLGVLWYTLAAIGALLLILSVARAVPIVRMGRRLRLRERRSGLNMAGVYEVDGIPGVSLVGVFRTRILIGSEVARQLTSDELKVAVAHELAHREACDNLARWWMLCAPDVFRYSAAARRLERDWHIVAESRADGRAVRGDRGRAVHLASALVKVARLSADAKPATPPPAWSTLNDPSLLERRVRRLLAESPPTVSARVPALALAVTLGGGLIAAVPSLAGSVHRLTEALVKLLP